MDTSDKATNKAMSAAYKYAALQAFAIPTEGDNDADSHTPEVAPKAPAVAKTLLTENQIADFTLSIGDADTEDALKKAYAGAYRLAQGQGDKKAIDIFTTLYAARKTALGVK
jgi:hypothetical protein